MRKRRGAGDGGLGMVIIALTLMGACVAPIRPTQAGRNAHAASRPTARPAPYGVLLLAHGGSKAWDRAVESIKKGVERKVPIGIAFGMAMPETIQSAIGDLQALGVPKIVAVPLFVNSNSELMTQTRYVLGLSERPSAVFLEALQSDPHYSGTLFLAQARASVPISMTSALDASPQVVDILYDRAKALSKNPRKETVLLVAHGPVTDKEDALWLKTMNLIAARIKSRGGFDSALAATLRDDAPRDVQAKARSRLRGMALSALRRGDRLIVIPDLIAAGGIESHIRGALAGLPYIWNGRALAPDPRLAQWVLEESRAAARLMR